MKSSFGSKIRQTDYLAIIEGTPLHRWSSRASLNLSLRDFLYTMAIVVASAFAAWFARENIGTISPALIFVVGITLSGALRGLAAALIAATSAFLLYNFFLAEPVLTLRLQTGSDITPLVLFNLCAVTTGLLAGRLKDRAEAANRSNLHLATLLEASSLLQSAIGLQDLAATLAEEAPTRLGIEVRLLRLKDGKLMPIGSDDGADVAQAAAEATRDVVRTPAFDGLVGFRLIGSEGMVGAMVVNEAATERLDAAFMTAFANLIGLALERAVLLERVTESRAAARTEQLQTALLASVSHDFRTPLTAISASASSLIAYRDRLGSQASDKLLGGIVEECDRLNRYTSNLLELSRLESGDARERQQTVDVADLLNAVLQRVRPRVGNRRIARAPLEAGLLIDADPALFELALTNIVDNAILYSEDHTTILIETSVDAGRCEVAISDEGQGIPPEDLDRVFQRFYRVSRMETSPRGSGLGLAIAKGFVEAFGGSIAAATPGIGSRGTRITVRLPAAELRSPE